MFDSTIIAGAVILFLAGLFWFMYQRGDRFLSDTPPPFTPLPEQLPDFTEEQHEHVDESAPIEQIPETKPTLPSTPDYKPALAKTHASFMQRVAQLFKKTHIDNALLDELEEALLLADVGVHFTGQLIDSLRDELKSGHTRTTEDVKNLLKQRMTDVLLAADPQPTNDWSTWLQHHPEQPCVILFVGVNGVGKTTSIGKIGTALHQANQNVVMAAGDTFRAAAADQLSIWADRCNAKLIRGDEGADPASVVFNAVEHAKQTNAHIVLADTAGRLHTKSNLMDEIKKVKRVLSKTRNGAPDETWLVVDATTGQNALTQAREFHQALGLTGIILTKLDGTAKGGVVISIANALKLPIRLVGLGEQANDLQFFNPHAFVDALFESV